MAAMQIKFRSRFPCCGSSEFSSHVQVPCPVSVPVRERNGRISPLAACNHTTVPPADSALSFRHVTVALRRQRIECYFIARSTISGIIVMLFHRPLICRYFKTILPAPLSKADFADVTTPRSYVDCSLVFATKSCTHSVRGSPYHRITLTPRSGQVSMTFTSERTPACSTGYSRKSRTVHHANSSD
jgi:hypothetical protein